jgi:hypothetical protein
MPMPSIAEDYWKLLSDPPLFVSSADMCESVSVLCRGARRQAHLCDQFRSSNITLVASSDS